MTIDASTVHTGFRPSGDEGFRKAVIEFARKLGDRAAAEFAPDPLEAAERRRAALHAYDRARLRRWLIAGSVVTGAAALLTLIAAALMWLPLWVGRSAVPPVEARPAQPARVTAAQISLPAPSPAPVLAQARAVKASWPIELAEAEPPPEVTMAELRASAVAVLRPVEVREAQGRLLAFGFDPGKVDGSEGPRTRAAAKAYREKRGLIPAVDSVDRNLLAALRSDPSPKAVAPRPRSNDPIDSIYRWWKTL
jgi:hypothetical protein